MWLLVFSISLSLSLSLSLSISDISRYIMSILLIKIAMLKMEIILVGKCETMMIHL